MACLSFGGSVWAISAPIPASPASIDGFAVTADRCPTFSWGAVPGARDYELVVYSVAESEDTRQRLVVRRLIPGGALSWTPSLEDCLEPGGRYAWLVRALSEDHLGSWSEARLFEVARAPSVEEVASALEVLERYLSAGGGAPDGSGPGPPSPVATRSGTRAAGEGTSERQGARAAAALGFPGTAVIGATSTAVSGENYGVHGTVASSDSGTSGVVGAATATSGDTRGVVGQVRSPTGVAGVFDATAGGKILSGLLDGTEVFSVESDGQVIAGGAVTAPGFLGDGSGLTGVIADWVDMTGVPTGFADGVDDDTTYAAGNQLSLIGTTFALLEGPGSDLDADSLDGLDSGDFATFGHGHFGQGWTGSAPGASGLLVSNTASADGGAAIRGLSPAGSGTTSGVVGVSSSTAGFGVFGFAPATSGTNYGVYGSTNSDQGRGVFGLATSATGTTYGVRGNNLSSSGHGVFGRARASSGLAYGVTGLSDSAGGIGVAGTALASSGFTIGVRGVANSPDGVAGVFDHLAGGKILSGRNNGSEVFSVAGDGQVVAAGFAGDGSALTNVAADWGALTNVPAGFADGVDDDTLYAPGNQLQLIGTRFGVVEGPGSDLDADTFDGLDSSSFSLSVHNHLGQTWNGSVGGLGLLLSNSSSLDGSGGLSGSATAITGNTFGLLGTSSSNSGVGVLGQVVSPTGLTLGVVGSSASEQGIGVAGNAPATTGFNIGVRGLTSSDSGTGVRGEAMAASGLTEGVRGQVTSPAGVAGVFNNVGAGQILSGRRNNAEVFSVEGDGQVVTAGAVTAPRFVGDGSALTDVAADWNLLVNLPAGFADGVDDDTTYNPGNQLVLNDSSFDVLEGAGSGLDADLLDGMEASAFAEFAHTHYGHVWAGSLNGPALTAGNSSSGPSASGLFGDATAPTGGTTGVWGRASSIAGFGVRGVATAGTGTAVGVFGSSDSTSGFGLWGAATANTGTNYGVYGRTNSSAGYAGYFLGRVHVTDMLSKGGGSFKIDHPLEPDRKYLYHSFVESPDMMNIYNGNVVLDENGEVWVELPEWFEALNRDFRYQLTAIGRPTPLWIAEKISGNRFKIAGGVAGTEVSWQVTGIRHDAWAEKHRVPVEEDKPADEAGTYLHPEELGLSRDLGLDWVRSRVRERAAGALALE